MVAELTTTMQNQTSTSGSSKQPLAGMLSFSSGQLPIMRSQLSARLLKNNPRSVSSDGEVTPWWKRGSEYKNVVKAMPLSAPGSLAGGSRLGESSGYNAGSERTSMQSEEMASPPVCIDFFARDRKRSSPKKLSDDCEKGKKRKFEEASYNAAMAKENIIRAGLTVPTLQQPNKTARLLPNNCGVSMSHVGHFYSKDVDDSPFLGSFPLKNASTDLYNDAAALSNIVKTCVSYYPSVSVSPLPTSSEKQLRVDSTSPNPRDYESSTSSVTEDMDSSEAEERETSIIDSKPNAAVVSMGDALSLCQDARIITASEAPYTIVHVNAAFTRVTGLASVKVLGRPFADLIENESLLETLQDAAATLKASIVANTGFKTKTLAKKQECMSCTVLVSPVAGVVSQPATHLVVEVKAEGRPASASSVIDSLLAHRQQSPPAAVPLQSIG